MSKFTLGLYFKICKLTLGVTSEEGIFLCLSAERVSWEVSSSASSVSFCLALKHSKLYRKSKYKQILNVWIIWLFGSQNFLCNRKLGFYITLSHNERDLFQELTPFENNPIQTQWHQVQQGEQTLRFTSWRLKHKMELKLIPSVIQNLVCCLQTHWYSNVPWRQKNSASTCLVLNLNLMKSYIFWKVTEPCHIDILTEAEV